jgi:hypothetical protein
LRSIRLAMNRIVYECPIAPQCPGMNGVGVLASIRSSDPETTAKAARQVRYYGVHKEGSARHHGGVVTADSKSESLCIQRRIFGIAPAAKSKMVKARKIHGPPRCAWRRRAGAMPGSTDNALERRQLVVTPSPYPERVERLYIALRSQFDYICQRLCQVLKSSA